MGKSFADGFLETFNGLELPMEISARFDVLECISENDYGETYLLAEKDSGKKFVLKCYVKSDDVGATREAELLFGLIHDGLPAYEQEIENDNMLFVLRGYIDGIPLDKFTVENRPDENKALSVIIEICDILTFLHSQPAPIIHRDIKPSNIIVDMSKGSVKLIDFGISRRYSEGSDFDTTYYGTKRYSPPEQYGFSQTDCRADIYALGVVFRFMLTGSVDGQVRNKALRQIIGKCTAFSPKDRYQSAKALKQALTRIKKPARFFTLRIAAAVPAAALFTIAAIWVFTGGGNSGGSSGGNSEDAYAPASVPASGTPQIEEPAVPPEPLTQQPQDAGEPSGTASKPSNGTPQIEGPAVHEPYVFIEPLIEEAVRLMLYIPDGQPVTETDLDGITELHITGNMPMRTEEEFGAVVNPGGWGYGTVFRLDDLRAMKSLRKLNLSGQPLTDLSPLADCHSINALNIHESLITDVSPLALMPRLRFLALQGNAIQDFYPFSEMILLEHLFLGWTQLSDISELGDCPNLTWLGISSTHITSLSGIERFTGLRRLDISGTNVNDFSALNDMPFLSALQISPEMERYIDTLSRDDVEIIIG